MHRQREALLRGPLGLGEVDLDLEGLETVVRHRVEQARADIVLRAQRSSEAVPVLRHPDGVLMVDVHRTLGDRWRGDALQVRRQERRVVLTRLGPPVDIGQLDPADRRVDVGHPVVEADDFVVVLLLHPLVAESRGSRSTSAMPAETLPPSPEVMFFVG